MPSVLNYDDYRPFLRDWLEESKKTRPYLSFRFLAGRLGLNAGFLAKVFNGTSQLSLKHGESFADFLQLTGKERKYFLELMHFSHAKSDTEAQSRFDRLQIIKGMEFLVVADDADEFYKDWWHFAMRSLLGIYKFYGHDYAALGSKLSPPITGEVAKASVELLRRLGMVKVLENGLHQVTETFISTGKGWTSEAIRGFQREMIRLGEHSLDLHPRNVRDISTVTLCFDRSRIDLIKERIRDFRQELLQMSQDIENEDSVLQLNIQLFPVAIMASGEGEQQ